PTPICSTRTTSQPGAAARCFMKSAASSRSRWTIASDTSRRCRQGIAALFKPSAEPHMNAVTIVALPLALMVLGGCALGPSASDSSATHSPLQVALQQLPVLDEQAPVLTETDLNFYSADPAR